MDSESSSESTPVGWIEEECRTVLDSVRRIVQLLRRSATSSEKQLGVSAAQLFVLHKLADAQALSVGELAQRTLTSQSSVSEVIQKLVTAGFVGRTRSARDARSVELSLTDTGRKLLENAPLSPQDFLLAGLKRMPPRDRRQLARLLTRLIKETGAVDLSTSPQMLFEEEDRAETDEGSAESQTPPESREPPA